MREQFHNISENEINGAFNVAAQKISRMVIYSHGKTIQHGLTYPMKVTVIANVGLATFDTDSTNGNTLNGTSTNLDKKSLTNYEGGIRLCENLKTTNYKNC